MRALVCLVVAGCGRVGFDARADGSPVCTWSAFAAPQKLPAVVQSTVDDWAPMSTLGGTEMFFYSYRGPTFATLWHAPTDPYAAAVEESELDTTSDIKFPALTDDALDLVYAVGGASFTLVETTRAATSDQFAAPIAIAALDAPGDSFAPSLTPDGLRLVFTSDRASPGGADYIYETTRTDRGTPWATPVQLTELGTVATGDNFPGATLSADDLDVFIAMRVGRIHIFHAHRAAVDQTFSIPVQVAELTSAMDDGGQHVSADGTTMLLNYDSDEAGGMNADLWSATRTCE